MKFRSIFIVLIFYLLIPIEVEARTFNELQQGIPITGTVTDEKGDPLPGVNIVVKGTTTGVVSDAAGRYSITAPDSESVLVFSFLGYATQEIAVGDRRNIDVTLGEEILDIEEVVVVGYGTQKKVNLTGAVDVIGSEVFVNRSISNTTQALLGAAPNLNINLSDGKPSRTAAINVRGNTSIGQGGSALVLIDGVEGDLASLNPNDIESVSVLKDASSAAVYGSRAAFGIVLITTKQPQKGKTTVNYTGNFSFQSVAKKPEFVTDGVTWLEHFREATMGFTRTPPTGINGTNQTYSDAWLDRMREWKASGEGPKTEVLSNGNYEYYSNTDWWDILIKDRVFVQDHNLNISGSNDKGDFYVSGRYYDHGGLYNFDPDVYRSYNFRAKSSFMAYKWLRLSNNMEYNNTFYHMPSSAENRTLNFQRVIAFFAYPTQPTYNPDGTYSRGGAHVVGSLSEGNNYWDHRTNLFKNTVGFNANFLDNTFRINGDYTFRYNTYEYMWKRMHVPYYSNINTPAYIGLENGQIQENQSRTMYSVSNVYAEYENTFAQKHYIKAMAGWNYETYFLRQNNISRTELLLGDATSVQLASGTAITPGASVRKWRTAGIFYRLNYGYQNRYLLELNGRYDGSSRFPTDQQWGFFPSVSGGWRLTEEPFWKVSKDVFSDIKFRVSYGTLGNGNIPPYTYLGNLSSSQSPMVLDGRLPRRISVSSPIPDGLTWEKVTTTNFGLDIGTIRNRLRFSGDYYVRKTTGMYTTGPELPQVFGSGAPRGNYADMTTKGFELILTWRDHFPLAGKPFGYQIRGTLHDYVATIDKFYNPTKRFAQHYEGKVMGELWGFETDGLFQEDPDPSEYINTVAAASNNGVWYAGDLKYRNRDGSEDNRITRGEQTVDNPGDMTIIGNTQPRYGYSFSLSVDWNGIFFSAFFEGVGRQHWYPAQESAFFGQYNRAYNQLPAWHVGNFWTPDNRDAYLPRYAGGGNSSVVWGNACQNDRYLQNIAYLMLKNIQIGYSLPVALVSKISMKSARIYLSGENLISWSPVYKVAPNFMDVFTLTREWDDDTYYDNTQGEGNTFPLLKTVSLGISLSF